MNIEDLIKTKEYYFVQTSPSNTETCLLKKDVSELLVTYGRYCAQQALDAALKNATIKEKFKMTWGDEIESYFVVDKDSILNSFSLDDIKE